MSQPPPQDRQEQSQPEPERPEQGPAGEQPPAQPAKSAGEPGRVPGSGAGQTGPSEPPAVLAADTNIDTLLNAAAAALTDVDSKLTPASEAPGAGPAAKGPNVSLDAGEAGDIDRVLTALDQELQSLNEVVDQAEAPAGQVTAGAAGGGGTEGAVNQNGSAAALGTGAASSAVADSAQTTSPAEPEKDQDGHDPQAVDEIIKNLPDAVGGEAAASPTEGQVSAAGPAAAAQAEKPARNVDGIIGASATVLTAGAADATGNGPDASAPPTTATTASAAEAAPAPASAPTAPVPVTPAPPATAHPGGPVVSQMATTGADEQLVAEELKRVAQGLAGQPAAATGGSAEPARAAEGQPEAARSLALPLRPVVGLLAALNYPFRGVPDSVRDTLGLIGVLTALVSMLGAALILLFC